MGLNKIYVGSKHNRIRFVSSRACQAEGFEVEEVDKPEDIKNLKDITDSYKLWKGTLVKHGAPVDIKKLKVALVGVYKIPCGIATYSEALWGEQQKLVDESHIFAEYADVPEEKGVTRCWQRGKPLTKLIAAIHKYKPDVVLVQHEFGVFPDARHWLSFLTAMQRYRTAVTLHSVFRHADKTICEAAIPEIFVHTSLAKDVLKLEKKIPGKVYVVPHGCFLPKNEPRLWNRYFTEHTVMQFGFGFRYKGWERSLEAIHTLKDKFPDIFFTGIFSEGTAGAKAHDDYFFELVDLIDKWDIADHVSLIRGFQSKETIETFLRMNRVAIFPYTNHPEHVVFGSTGAAREAMSEGVPIIVSDVPLFHDLEGVCPRAKSVSELCSGIETFFNIKSAKEQIEKQDAFLNLNSWAQVALKQLQILSVPPLPG